MHCSMVNLVAEWHQKKVLLESGGEECRWGQNNFLSTLLNAPLGTLQQGKNKILLKNKIQLNKFEDLTDCTKNDSYIGIPWWCSG